MPREKISARPRNKSTWTCDGLAAARPCGTAVVDCLAWAKAPVENAISHAAAASFIGNSRICNLVSIFKADSPPVPADLIVVSLPLQANHGYRPSEMSARRLARGGR